MLTSYIKERLSRPYLSKVEENQTPILTKPSALEKLKTLKPGELFLDDEEDSDSDILDPFEDSKRSKHMEKLFKKTKKKLTRLENNIHLMSSFSEEFKIAMDEARDELEIKASDNFYEEKKKINETLRKSRHWSNISKSMEAKLDNLFECDDFNCGPDLDIHTPRKSAKRDDANNDSSENGSQEKEDLQKSINDSAESVSGSQHETDYDVMSGIWNMFNTSEDLVCTTPNYDAYRQQSPHWLERECVSWATFDKARIKCVNWLQKNEHA